jgi:SPP1 family predicted phage head-tail adaptor
MGIRAGTLRKRITFQTRSTTQDAVGGQSVTWSDLLTTWASLEPSAGRELMSAQAMNVEQPTTITVRWQSELSNFRAVAAMRVVYGSRIFNIHSSQNQEERNRILVLIASEGLNDG